ncbi:MAG: PqqD family protein [Acidobacteriota bacterium]
MRRTRELLWDMVGNEIVVLDQAGNRAHRLDRITARVWRQCDGKHTVTQLGQLLEEELGVSSASAHQQVVESLTTLTALELLDRGIGISRREAAGRVVMAGSALVAVSSVVVPTPARAASGPVRPIFKRK